MSEAAVHSPVARSPIAPAAPVVVVAGWEVSGARASGELTLRDCTALSKVLIRAPFDGRIAAEIGVPFGRAARVRPGDAGHAIAAAAAAGPDVLVAGSGPGEWLAIGPPGRGADLVDWLAVLGSQGADEHVSVVDLTHGRALVRLTGPHAADVLASVCGIDLSDPVTPDGAAFRSAVAALATDVIRDDAGGSRSYLLHCERSSGQYLFDALLRAGARFGIEIDGFAGSDAQGDTDVLPD